MMADRFIYRTLIVTVVIIGFLGVYTACADSGSISSDLQKRYARLNGFVENLYSLHKKRIENRLYYEKESIGGYGGQTDNLRYYKELKYFDKESDWLLSIIKWERKNPDNIHMIDVYIYDDENRILREYSATYLPSRRAAPLETLITRHYYRDDLHSFREYDASDILIYEQCNSIKEPANIYFALHYEDIPDTYKEIEKDQQDRYRACFDHADKSAGPFTNPLAELSR